MGDRLTPKYFAVLDPDDAGQMTYWRRNQHGGLMPWPLKATYGPILWKQARAGHRHVTPAGLRGHDRAAWVRDWYATIRAAWTEQVEAAIATDPVGCARRFAEFCIRCCVCGRVLVEDYSKVVGIGPECRRGVPGAILAEYLTPRVGAVHAASGTEVSR